VGESYVTIYRHFNILLFLGINIIISGTNNIVKEGPLPQYYILHCRNLA